VGEHHQLERVQHLDAPQAEAREQVVDGAELPERRDEADDDHDGGRTNGRMVRAFSVRRPGNSKRARTYAPGSPRTTLASVESAAW